MIRIAALTGLRAEARLLRRAAAGTSVMLDVAVSGADPARAEQEAERLAHRSPRLLLSFGLAGGLDPALRSGDLVAPREVVLPQGGRLPVDPAWHDTLRAAVASPLSDASVAGVAAAVATADAKHDLALRSGAGIADMESHVLAVAARRHGLPVLVLRAVCDPAQQDVPEALLRLVDHRGRLRLRLLPLLLRHPAAAGRLAGQSRRAGRALGKAAQQFLASRAQ